MHYCATAGFGVSMCEPESKKALSPARMSVMTPERPETPRSAALSAEKPENGRTREADEERERKSER